MYVDQVKNTYTIMGFISAISIIIEIISGDYDRFLFLLHNFQYYREINGHNQYNCNGDYDTAP